MCRWGHVTKKRLAGRTRRAGRVREEGEGIITCSTPSSKPARLAATALAAPCCARRCAKSSASRVCSARFEARPAASASPSRACGGAKGVEEWVCEGVGVGASSRGGKRWRGAEASDVWRLGL